MGLLSWQVDLHNKKTDEIGFDYSSTSQTLDAYGVQVTIGLADKKDTFQFNLLNINRHLTKKIQLGDNIKIYHLRNNTKKFIIDGIVNQPTQQVDDSGRVYLVKGTSRTEFLLNAMVFNPVKGPLKLPALIKAIIDQVNNLNLRSQRGGERTIHYNNTTIVQSKSDGSAFTDNAIGANQTLETKVSAFQLLRKYSSHIYTGDNSYIFWIDENNFFHWTFRSRTTIVQTLTEGTLQTINGSQLGVTLWKTNFNTDIFNFVNLIMGKTPGGQNVYVPSWDFPSIQKHGMRYKMVTDFSNRGNELMLAEEKANPDSFDTNQSRYPISSKYPYTTLFKKTAGSDTEYNQIFKDKLLSEGKEAAEIYLKQFGKPKLQVQAEMPRNNGFNIGDLIHVQFISNQIEFQDLRVVELTYTDTDLVITMEEDFAEEARQFFGG